MVVQEAESPTSRRFAPLVRWLFVASAVAAGYYLCAFVGTELSLQPSGFAILWPATAFLTAALIALPPREAWLVPLAVIPAHLALVSGGPVPPEVALTQVGGNLALAAATTLAVRRTSGGPLRLDSFRSALTFILIAGVAVPAVMNALILSIHLVTGWARDFWLSWRQWMLASVFPTVTLVPLVVLAARGRLVPGDGWRRLEAAILCAVLFGLSLAVSGSLAEAEYGPTLRLLPLPLLLWAAARWGVGGACLALIVFASAILIRALGGHGPFGGDSATVTVLSLQVYLITVSIAFVLLAALMEERRRAEAALQRSEARIEMAAAATDTGLCQWDEASHTLWMTEHCRGMFGLPAGTELTFERFHDMLHPDDRARVSATLKTLRSADVNTLREFRILRGGEVRWFVLSTRAERDETGRTIRINGVFRDVTGWIDARRQAQDLSRRLLTLQEDERRSIAEELQDATGQHLAAARLAATTLRRRLTLTDTTRTLLDDIQTSLAAAATELRTFTYLLRPPALERQGVNDVLRQYVGGFGRRAGIDTRLRLSPRADRLPPEQQLMLLRVAQESLTNIYRHAAARRIVVRLRFEGERLHLLIRDDGRGLSPATGQRDGAPVRVGVGLPGMAARVQQAGGRLAIRSGPGGTQVHAVLPVAEVEPDPAPAPRRSSAIRETASG